MVTFEAMRTEAEKIHDAAVMERVKRGMALLERLHGPDWVEHIDMETLWLAEGNRCVLGQLYAKEAKAEAEKIGHDLTGYEWALEHIPELSDRPMSASHHGFLAVGYNDDRWDVLQDAWERALGG